MNVFLILGLFSETSGGEMIKLKTFIKIEILIKRGTAWHSKKCYQI
jgi:hypothetical protein